ncbi:hypothetical protein [Rhodomicrobium lacus]|uniref:hypothetical protein n=1 Tax=Rhodomicrobium lacus TaxID=2498452 RepID=UPI0013DFD8B1|nr:hypothetical protein [Rhodomicrobium lacus]
MPAPPGDLTAPRLKQWIDGRELQLVETQRAGLRLASTYDACAKHSPAPADGSGQ